MAEIVDLASARSKREPCAQGPRAQGAEIVLFTGVRYERHAEPPQARAERKDPTKRGSRARDRLEIAD